MDAGKGVYDLFPFTVAKHLKLMAVLNFGVGLPSNHGVGGLV